MKKKLKIKNEKKMEFSFKKLNSEKLSKIYGGLSKDDPTPQGDKGGVTGSDSCACGCL